MLIGGVVCWDLVDFRHCWRWLLHHWVPSEFEVQPSGFGCFSGWVLEDSGCLELVSQWFGSFWWLFAGIGMEDRWCFVCWPVVALWRRFRGGSPLFVARWWSKKWVMFWWFTDLILVLFWWFSEAVWVRFWLEKRVLELSELSRNSGWWRWPES